MKNYKTVKVISLEATQNTMCVWVESTDAYIRYEITPTQIDEMERHLKGIYSSYEHFAAVVGKFDPYTFFFIEPVRVPLTFDALRDEANRRRQANQIQGS